MRRSGAGVPVRWTPIKTLVQGSGHGALEHKPTAFRLRIVTIARRITVRDGWRPLASGARLTGSEIGTRDVSQGS